jgi:hypothetical protein
MPRHTRARTPTPATTPAELRLLITELHRVAPYVHGADVAFLCHAAADTLTLLSRRVNETDRRKVATAH